MGGPNDRLRESPEIQVPTLSVVIAARDAAETLGAQLDALADQVWECPWEVVVVDNGSVDRTPAIVEAAAEGDPRFRLIRAAEKAGAGYARNCGVAAASADLIAFCDADDVVAPGWVAAMGDALVDHELTTGPLELNRLNPPWLADSRGRALTRGPTSFHGYFDFGSTCNVGVRKGVFEDLGGFDNRYVPAEDCEFGLRADVAGFTTRYVPNALVHYRYRETREFRRARQYGAMLPVIADRLRAEGRPAPGRLDGWRNWLWLIRHLGMLASRSGRARWTWVAGNRVGTVLGGLRTGSPYL